MSPQDFSALHNPGLLQKTRAGAKALLRHSFLAWHGQKALGRKSTAKGDVFTMGTAPLSAAIYQSAVIRPDATISSRIAVATEPGPPTNLQGLGVSPGDATPPPPPPPARRNSLPGGRRN
eukprot:Skav202955  [mRNA]  locus=scaffold2274:53153:60277:+ [translate_table: standard]